MRSFIHDIVEEDKGRSKGVQKIRKKSKAEMELDKLAFFVNYDHLASGIVGINLQMGVKLLGF